MRLKKTLAVLGLGVALGYTIKTQLAQMPIRPEQALKHAKEQFKKQGAVSGSWIYMKTEDMNLHGLTYKVYRGGITRTINDHNNQYEFYVDANTGSIISTEQTNNVL
ncbi:PepSY domain-containing protein [Amphibacillus jilinensis]|uniref:PepSY domain-containing protein n=1 Tax=Amphibacillus jilinensis TaxID=1216008 RepID=UPI00030D365F|nr:PepSY domain-containing protein [Amphibacillus jilinensis]